MKTFSDEIDSFTELFEYYLEHDCESKSPQEVRLRQIQFRDAVNSLKKANSNFLGALVVGLVALILSFFVGYDFAAATFIIAFVVPF